MPESASHNRVLVIASGSSGNCYFIQAGNAKMLVDIGISCGRVVAGLASIGVKPHDIDAVFITHEHGDHVSGLELFSTRYHKTVYATAGTLGAFYKTREISRQCDITTVKQFSTTVIKETEISTFRVEHDVAEPIGISVSTKGFKGAVATDLGCVTDAVFDHLKKPNVLVFESNYDEKMLIDGEYPWFLKQRIMGKGGHLSNADSSNALLKLNWKGLTHVYAAHISQKNNTHRLVLSNYKKAFERESHKPVFIPTLHDRESQCYGK